MRTNSLAGIEVSTSGIKVVAAGFGLFPSLVHKLLVARGVLRLGEAIESLPDDRWFPLEVWLSVHETIYKEVGPNALFTLGTRILENPKFPDSMRDIDSALASIDVAYHRSHRKAGLTMYDEATKTMMEGIGHYRARRLTGERRMEVVSDTPYPCEADSGIVTRMATQFQAKAAITHGPVECRRKGGTSCTYTVVW